MFLLHANSYAFGAGNDVGNAHKCQLLFGGFFEGGRVQLERTS